MHNIKSLIKSSIAYLLYYTGFIGLLCKSRLQGKLVVLMYHRVLNDHEVSESFSNSGIIVKKNSFESQIDHLSKHFTPLSIDQVSKKIEEKLPFECGDCLVTFDDGWYDNYQNALPVLESHNVPSLIFLPINFIGTDELFWQEKLASYIFHLTQKTNEISPILQKYGLSSLNREHPDTLRASIFQYLGALKQKSNEEIDFIVNEFKEYAKRTGAASVGSSIDKYINWEQAKEMSKRGVKFGSHAISHRLLTKLDEEDLKQELTQSRQINEEKLDAPIISIAYPNGNFNDSVTRNTQAAGYKLGFTTIPGYFSIEDNPLEIKRINIHQNATRNIPLFLCRILGIF